MTIGSKAQVFHGTVDRTSGGLTKSSLKQLSSGRIVSRAKSDAGHHNPALKAWREALMIAREMYRREGRSTDGFLPLRKSSEEYRLVREIYDGRR